ncbi:hypothetical protein HDU79_011561 [Rhizoclosmatium sp. JEL0117]|nr:hypothetical protein HDU79_011561 [Rhizoclosmatium sp. JEL0117]
MQGTLPPPPQLPPGFIAQWSNQYQQYFYVNTATSQSQWDIPTQQYLQPPGPPPQAGSYATPMMAPQQMQPVQQQQPIVVQQQATQKEAQPEVSTGAALAGGAVAGAAGVLAVQGLASMVSTPDYVMMAPPMMGGGGYGGQFEHHHYDHDSDNDSLF